MSLLDYVFRRKCGDCNARIKGPKFPLRVGGRTKWICASCKSKGEAAQRKAEAKRQNEHAVPQKPVPETAADSRPAFALWQESGVVKGLWIRDYETTQNKMRLKTIIAGYIQEGFALKTEHYAQIDLGTYQVVKNENKGGGWLIPFQR